MKRLLLSFTILAALGTTHAVAGEAGLPTYVSERFQATAEELARQIAVSQVARVCPSDAPLCSQVVGELSKTFREALRGDSTALQESLKDFFMIGSVAGLMQAVAGNWVEASDHDRAAAVKVIGPVLGCISGTLSRAPDTDAICSFDKRLTEGLVSALTVVGVRGKDATALATAVTEKPVRAGEVSRSLAMIAGRYPFDRQDIEVYLTAIARLLDARPADGLFDASFRFLEKIEPSIYTRAVINEQWQEVFLLATPSEVTKLTGVEASMDDAWKDSLAACGMDQKPLQDFIEVREKTRSALREALILGKMPELRPIDQLTKYDPRRCTGESKDRQKHQENVKLLRKWAKYLQASLRVGGALRSYAAPGLVAAALLDYVRTKDERALEAALSRSLLFAAAQLVAYTQAEQALAQENSGGKRERLSILDAPTERDVLTACEFQRTAALFGLDFTAGKDTMCYELATKSWKPFGPEELRVIETVPPGTLSRHVLWQFATYIEDEASVTVDAEAPTREMKNGKRILGALLLTDPAAPVEPLMQQTWTELLAAVRPGRDGIADPGLRKRLALTARELVKGVSTPSASKAPSLTPDQFVATLLFGNPARIEEARGPASPALSANDRALLTAGRLKTLIELGDQVRVRLKTLPPTSQRLADGYKQVAAVLDAVAPDIRGAARDAGLNVQLFDSLVFAGLEGRPADARKALLRSSSDFLIAQVDAFTVKLIGPDPKACDSTMRWASIFTSTGGACTAQVLIRSAYRPVADFVSQEEKLTPESAKQLADRTYRDLFNSKAVDRSPLLLHIGLGVNHISKRRDENDDFVTLTLLDQIGVAFLRYSWDDYQFEMGPFVGGFLDALIRAASNNNTERFWLAGYSVGFPRMFGTGAGFQLHIGYALPFEFNSSARFTYGGSVVIPFDLTKR